MLYLLHLYGTKKNLFGSSIYTILNFLGLAGHFFGAIHLQGDRTTIPRQSAR